ncbi:MAG: RpiB/LacA/LacB family sugar-phosphate isomerase [Elusimicrobiota bacterium]|jgi:ribose 5-phosphate isomerase B|nr:RpiB/LacA/LacB family sugar-phosphate isomerase [Elusimicrobiota bacterium]
MEDKKEIKIAFATDHAASQVREAVKNYLISIGYEVEDFGYSGEDSCDYPDYAYKAALSVQQGKADKGVLICGTGIGMAIAANKVKGIIAATVWNDDTARLAAQHNKANILCIGSRTATLRELCSMSKTFLQTAFEERHSVRIQKIKDIENKQN